MLVLFLLIVVETIMPIPVERETQETSTYTYVSDIADLDTIRKAKNKVVVSNLVEKKELDTEDQTKTLVSKMERCHLIKVAVYRLTLCNSLVTYLRGQQTVRHYTRRTLL